MEVGGKLWKKIKRAFSSLCRKNIDTRKSPLPVIISCIIKTENRDLISRCDNVLFLALLHRLYVISYLFVLSHILGFEVI